MRLSVIDSHTGGEPTRVILEGGIPMEGATMEERRADFARRFDHLRSGLVNEPRGSEVLVGAALTPPVSADALCGVVYFNTASYLGMCGHGTIGLIETLRHLGRITPGTVKLDTPVGTVQATLHEDGRVEIRNVVSYRYAAGVKVEVEGLGTVEGDIGYGGNWFFIVHHPLFDVQLANEKALNQQSWAIRHALAREGITGANGAEIDHIELEGDEGQNYVLCPGGAYDRSPCGTGTSAKMACLYAAGRLKAGEEFLQKSVIGSSFLGRVEPVEGGVIPTIIGRAHVTGESTLIFGDDDPLRWGLAT